MPEEATPMLSSTCLRNRSFNLRLPLLVIEEVVAPDIFIRFVTTPLREFVNLLPPTDIPYDKIKK
jgi:hypothetical protein